MSKAQAGRKTYGQYCGLARALDVVGDRWTMLVVRELLIGPRRFGELQAGLSGVASNLLTDRLKQMERDGLLGREVGAPGTGVRYALTTRGAELREAIEAMVRWSIPLMLSGRGDQEVRPEWLAVALPALIRSRPRRRIRISINTGGQSLLLTTGHKGADVSIKRADAVDAEITAEPEVLLGLAVGVLDIRSAGQRGAAFKGDRSAFAHAFGAQVGTLPRPGGGRRARTTIS